MEVKEAIQKRKSIRVFQKKEVPKGLILELIEAARLAPTARNTQPARFKLVRQGGTMERLRQEKAFVQDFV
jgi:nitroreductase